MRQVRAARRGHLPTAHGWLLTLSVALLVVAACSNASGEAQRAGDGSKSGEVAAAEKQLSGTGLTLNAAESAELRRLLALGDQRKLDAFYASLLAEAKKSPSSISSGRFVLPRVDTNDPRLFMVGDSVLLSAWPTAAAMLPSWRVTADAKVGRRVPEGATVIEQSRSKIGDVAVVLLGHNYDKGEGFRPQLDRIMRSLHSLKRVVLVTVAEWSPGQLEVNREIRLAPTRYPNVVVADWSDVLHANPGYTGPDHVHLTALGIIALADLIARAVGPGPIRGVPGIITTITVPAPYPGSGSTYAGGTTPPRLVPRTPATISPPSQVSTTVARAPSTTAPVGPSTTIGAPTTVITEPPTTAPVTTAPPTTA